MGLEFARREARLRDFIRAKQDAGVIPEDLAKEILSANEPFYRSSGVWREPGDQNAMHSASETRTAAAVQRAGYYLLERTLLERCPDMAEEIRNLTTAHRRG